MHSLQSRLLKITNEKYLACVLSKIDLAGEVVVLEGLFWLKM